MSGEIGERLLFVETLDGLLEALASERQLYVPRAVEAGHLLVPYEGLKGIPFNPIRTINPIKELLVPICEPVASMPAGMVECPDAEPFAVFGLKPCDLKAIDILDKVFLDRDLEDSYYLARRALIMLVCSDCTEPGPSCFCNLLGGKPYPDGHFDLNISKVSGGFVVQAGSRLGKEFMERHKDLFGQAPQQAGAEILQRRKNAEAALGRINSEWPYISRAKELLEQGYEHQVFEDQGKVCVECQACTRVCPTCHCFYLYDAAYKEYFLRMKMWDSCIRRTYAQVAGGENPRRMLSDRLRHRLMHKFVYFPDRYGLQMCVGCGRCIDAETGGVDIRDILDALVKADVNGK